MPLKKGITLMFYARSWLFCVISILFSLVTYSQNDSIASIPIPKDSISYTNDYITDHKKRFNVKLEVGNDISTYEIKENDLDLYLKPNLNLRYAVVFSYKFLSVRIGIRPKISDEQEELKGGSDTFRFRIQALFDNWNHVLEYNIDKGFYLSNTNEIINSNSDIRIQFPELSSNVLFGSSSYKFNENYSMRAIQSQTEIQTKSAGSFMPGIGYVFYSLSGTDVIKDIDGEIVYRDNYSEYGGFNVSLLLGYYYTFVLKKNWYLNAYGVPSFGVDFYQTKNISPEGTNTTHFNDTFISINYGFGGGYNGDKFFFGIEFKNRFTNEKFSANRIKISPSKNQFNVFFGYRFKTPKTVSAPVDYMENKIPILKDD
ncbi:DUF4421 family protein [Lutimonas zeaxanthinifaciens]|uniref:DUF4421 family protein n=1 Tax=Lutimonas zeaxanthinifaciens TaxID=3060215 RepID=UPI00265D4350|nr:DUF4421 family protein [Lutimonas sp. YSD2104]WKK64693.1 DUF4421 family protein [Lutimonas sp. YSD2104]